MKKKQNNLWPPTLVKLSLARTNFGQFFCPFHFGPFSLGQHRNVWRKNKKIEQQLQFGELVVAYQNDICVIITPNRALPVHKLLQHELWKQVRIRVDDGKTQVWNKNGVQPRGCDTIDRAGRTTNVEFTTIWRGSALPTENQGIKVLGSLLGHDDFVHAHLERTRQVQRTLLQRIPGVPDVESA